MRVETKSFLTDKPPIWADWLLTFWVIIVGVFYFGGYFLPDQIGRYTTSASALYALMLLISAGMIAFRYLRGREKIEE
ncbi:MAG: hypothetical protein ACRYFS_23750 [Janthinobacterium lividum]